MKKFFFLYLYILLVSCKEEPTPSTTGEISVEKMTEIKEYILPSPKVISTVAFIAFIDGTLKNDITIKIYNSNGDRFIIERIIPKGTYSYTTREFRVDYYEAQDVLLQVVPSKGSEESFKLKWGII